MVSTLGDRTVKLTHYRAQRGRRKETAKRWGFECQTTIRYMYISDHMGTARVAGEPISFMIGFGDAGKTIAMEMDYIGCIVRLVQCCQATPLFEI